MKTEEKILSEQNIFDGRVFSVRKYSVALPDGTESFREEVLHRGGACMIAVDNGEIVFVSQYRLAAKKDLLEIPAGKLEEGEDPQKAAERELIEEVGLRSKKTSLIAAVYPSPGYTNEKIYIYYCESFERVAQKLDKGEFLNVVKIPVEKAFEMVESGEICDGKTVIALLYLKNKRKTA